jgi:hypothetical protein
MLYIMLNNVRDSKGLQDFLSILKQQNNTYMANLTRIYNYDFKTDKTSKSIQGYQYINIDNNTTIGQKKRRLRLRLKKK